MELIAYVVMAIGAYVALIAKRPGFVYGWFAVFIVYSLIVRISPPTTPDMPVYYDAAETWPRLTQYTLREPVVWFGLPLLYKVIGTHTATFVIIDVLSAAIVVRTMKTMSGQGESMLSLAPTIICSYVLLFGQQNVFRQHVAFVILLWALAARSRNQRSSLVLLVISALTHNATVLLFGYWFDVGRHGKPRYGPFITFVGVIALGVLLPFLRKSSSATELNTVYLYYMLAGAFGLLMLYANVGRLSSVRSSALFNFLAFAPAIGILASAQFERVAMMFLILMIVDLYKYHAPLRLSRMQVGHLAYLVLVIPVFLFPSALRMLL